MKLPYVPLIVLCLGAPQLVLAHPAEQGFVLLLPTDIYIAAGTAAVAASLVLVGALSPQQGHRMFRPLDLAPARALHSLKTITSLCATALFFGLLYVGVTGPNDPLSNLLPLTIWTVWWVGFVVAQALFGDLWSWVNPWDGLYAVLRPERPPLALPRWLAAWPAVGFLLAFNGFAIADIAPSDPDRLAQFALGYWAFTFLGMIMFGADRWLSQVEVFTVFFRMLATLAPIGWGTRVKVGWPGWQALSTPLSDPSRAVFCLVLLGSGSFDGLHETFWWLDKIGINPLAFPGRSAVIWHSTMGLIVGNLILIAVFALAVWAGVALANLTRSGNDPLSFVACFCAFAISILPIALGYHFAHFLTSFMVQIQYVMIAATDPMVRGSDLLGLGPLQVTTGFLNTQDTVRRIWLTQAGAVVFSHILSVLMAHNVASHLWPDRAGAVRLQVGLGVLMIAYTVFGLWLLATPRGV